MKVSMLDEEKTVDLSFHSLTHKNRRVEEGVCERGRERESSDLPFTHLNKTFSFLTLNGSAGKRHGHVNLFTCYQKSKVFIILETSRHKRIQGKSHRATISSCE